jgi:nucleotide-binding universal stress UspA family protein
MSERILIAVDTTTASEEAVRYAGDLLADADATFVLFHLIEPPPGTASDFRPVPGMLAPVPAEHGSDPARYRRHLADEACARPVLDRLATQLVERGVALERIEEFWLQAHQDRSLGRGILAGARSLRCRTVVVGHHALPWYRETVHRHVGDWLTRHALGATVCIVQGEGRRATRRDEVVTRGV